MGKYRLLVISTDTEMSMMLQIYFAKLEYDVDYVSSVDDAVNRVDSQRPHLIFIDSDVAFSELAPIESKLHDIFVGIPIIWIYTTDDRPDLMGELDFDFDDYISKPFDIEELRLRVQNTLRRAQL